MGVLTAVAIPYYNSYKKDALEKAIDATLKNTQRAMDVCIATSDSISECNTGALDLETTNKIDSIWIFTNTTKTAYMIYLRVKCEGWEYEELNDPNKNDGSGLAYIMWDSERKEKIYRFWFSGTGRTAYSVLLDFIIT